MFISPAFAQTAGAGGADAFQAFMPLILIFVVFYFLLIRPQQKKMKQHREMLAAIRRGDKVITGGGILGTVSKVENDDELTVEIAKDVKVRVQRSTVAAVVNRTDPVSGKPANDSGKSAGFLSGLFGGGSKRQAPAVQPEPQPEPEASSSDTEDKDGKKDGGKS